jgi:hypothetical protein
MERVDERVEDQAPPAPRSYSCPECRQEFPSPEDLGVHLERHSPTDLPVPLNARKTPDAHPCPKGCGRIFPTTRYGNSKEMDIHATNCDGSPPIVGAGATNEETGKP